MEEKRCLQLSVNEKSKFKKNAIKKIRTISSGQEAEAGD